MLLRHLLPPHHSINTNNALSPARWWEKLDDAANWGFFSVAWQQQWKYSRNNYFFSSLLSLMMTCGLVVTACVKVAAPLAQQHRLVGKLCVVWCSVKLETLAILFQRKFYFSPSFQIAPKQRPDGRRRWGWYLSNYPRSRRGAIKHQAPCCPTPNHNASRRLEPGASPRRSIDSFLTNQLQTQHKFIALIAQSPIEWHHLLRYLSSAGWACV